MPEPVLIRDVQPAHGHTITIWTDASVNRRTRKAAVALVMEEHGEYIGHYSRRVEFFDPNEAEWAAVLDAQNHASLLSPDEQARTCIITDSYPVLARWWTYDSFRGGVPVFYQPRNRRSVAYLMAHRLATWECYGRVGAGPQASYLWSSR